MDIQLRQIRRLRLTAHHLDRAYPPACLLEAAGACGVQNSPPGAWETALFNRLEGCALADLHRALYQEKTLLQAWSFRGAPVVFPAGESGVFLTPLLALPGEEPWIYTLGLSGALEHLGMDFHQLLPLAREAAGYLEGHTVQGKEALDQILARRVREALPAEKRPLWDAPSIYGRPDRQTMGEAAVSFLLRPCAFSSLVVFGERAGTTPTFTSFQSWLGRPPAPYPGGDKALVRKFLHCYGPATPADFAAWLGASRRQAKRLWDTVAEELAPVAVSGKTRYLLAEDLPSLTAPAEEPGRLLLLGPHDPYLDLRDRGTILAGPALQRVVWKTVGNPGAVLLDGQVVGTWSQRTAGGRLDIGITLFQPLSPAQRGVLKERAEGYAAFRHLGLRSCAIQ